MNDLELAEEIERAAILLETFAEHGMVDKFLTGKRTPNSFLCEEVAKSLRDKIAALRRGPEPFMLDCLAGKLTTWEAICGYVSKLELQLAKRPPSDEMVMVPREPTDVIVWAICDHSDAPIDRERCLRCPAKEPTRYGEGTRGCRALAEDQYRAMLSAAEAEGMVK